MLENRALVGISTVFKSGYGSANKGDLERYSHVPI